MLLLVSSAQMLPQKTGLNGKAVQARFVMDGLSLEEAFLRMLRFPHANCHSASAPVVLSSAIA
jgi:hypothetical protein